MGRRIRPPFNVITKVSPVSLGIVEDDSSSIPPTLTFTLTASSSDRTFPELNCRCTGYLRLYRRYLRSLGRINTPWSNSVFESENGSGFILTVFLAAD